MRILFFRSLFIFSICFFGLLFFFKAFSIWGNYVSFIELKVGGDKMLHLFSFLFLSFFWISSIHESNLHSSLNLIIIRLFILALSSEFAQLFLISMSFDFIDLFYSFAGITIGLTLATFLLYNDFSRLEKKV